ncbi:hypothetical protein [Specibacter cremeus]|uniref:hypothetical protein n=1 Tax=Specibacter cremeus TaxID=1629051 RepID=UPI000F77917A|nr:hypothetical protein [Specibacter cremeus]
MAVFNAGEVPPTTVRRFGGHGVLRRWGISCVLYFAAVAALLAIAPHLPARLDLAMVGLASLVAGTWCGRNFWRCHRAHCVITAVGWLGIAALAGIGAELGHSLIGGYEEPVFMAVLGAGFAFEYLWYLVHGTSTISRSRPHGVGISAVPT